MPASAAETEQVMLWIFGKIEKIEVRRGEPENLIESQSFENRLLVLQTGARMWKPFI